jgi:hypothetical protein
MRFVRRWWWAILLVLVVVLRIALPSILRSQIETRASEALRAKVHVGDVQLKLLGGGVALEDVDVRATDAPPDEQPLIGWKRLAVDLRWWPLVHKILRFEEIDLVEPHVALDRLQSGDINLAALLPKSEPAPEGAPPAQPSTWKAGIDTFVLTRGGIRFRDLLVPNAEPVALGLESIVVNDIAIAPDVYGGPANLKILLKLDQGVARTRVRLTPRDDGGIAADVTLVGEGIPLHRSRVYVPNVAWSELTGTLSFALHHHLVTGGRNDLSGTLHLDDLTVWTAELDEPSLKWKRLDVALDKIDLVAHAANVKSVAIDGAIVPVRPRGPKFVPVVAAVKAARAANEPPPASAAEPEPPSAPWSWSLGSLALHHATLRLLSDQPPLEVATTLDAKSLSGPKHDTSPVKLDLVIGDGKLGIDGTLRIEPLGFAGKLTSAALDVPKLVDVVGGLPPNVLQVAKLDTDLDVKLGSSAPTAGDVAVSGTATVADLWVAANDPKEFATGAKKIAVAIDDVTVPGALAKEPGGARPMAVKIATVDVDSLYSRITRTETGIILPAFTSKPAGDAAAAPAAAPAPAAPARASAPAGAGPQITIAALTLAKGRADVTDRTVKPFYWGAFDPIDGRLEQIHTPDFEIGKVDLHMKSTAKGTIDVTGALTKKSDLQLVIKDLTLPQFNPYVRSLSSYSIARGSLFITTKAGIDGPRYDTTTYLTLSGFDLASRSGQELVLESLGIPLTVAIALLRDWKGNIDLTIPVKIDEKGSQIGMGTIVTGALVKALVGTLMSPLKIVGAILPTGGSGAESLAPKPVRFHPGSRKLDSDGQDQVKQLAAFLASRPGLGVTLASPPTPADVRGLREQALLAQLGPRGGVVGTLRNVGARGRIIDALTARAEGEEGALEGDDAKALDAYLEDVPPPSAEALKKLGNDRVAVVEKSLREDYGIGAEQVSRIEEPGTVVVDGDPAVRVELGSAKR